MDILVGGTRDWKTVDQSPRFVGGVFMYYAVQKRVSSGNWQFDRLDFRISCRLIIGLLRFRFIVIRSLKGILIEVNVG